MRAALASLRLVAQVIGLHAAHHEECGVRVEQRAQQDRVPAHRTDQFVARDDRPAHHVAVTGCVLREAVHEYVDAVLAVVVETRECVVEHGQCAMRMRGTGDTPDVRDARDRVGRTLEPDKSCRPPGKHPLNACIVLDGQHRVFDAKAAEQPLDQLSGGRVGLNEAQHMFAGTRERQEAARNGRST